MPTAKMPTAEKERLAIIIVEDDEDDFFITRSLLTRAAGIRCEVQWKQAYEEGLEAICSGRYDVALVDYRLGAHDGLELLVAARRRGSRTPVILLTGQGDLEIDLRAMTAGAADYLIKGEIDAPLLERSVRFARERHRAEEALRESEARYRLLAENATDLISVHLPDGTCLYASPASRTMLGYEPEELLGRPMHKLVHPEDAAKARAMAEAMQAQRTFTTSCRARRKDGSYCWVEATARAVHDEETGRVREVVAVARDVTERKRAEEQIREQAALLDEARDAISATDLDGRVIYWNKSAERLTGYTAEDLVGERADADLFDGDQDRVAQARQEALEQGAWSGDLHLCTRSGEEVIVESRWTLVRDSAGRPKSVLIINTDITERKKLEAQFLRAQRMESIGRLVGGIAHDLGNLLVPVQLGVKVLRQQADGNPKMLRTLDMIQKSAQRGGDMVRQVLAFARGVEGERAPLQLGQVIREVERMTEETFSGQVDVRVSVAGDLWTVIGDATQMQQVLMNLCVNAHDAMPEGGRLTIRAENLVLDEAGAEAHLGAEPGAYVRITVADTGTGIPPEVVDKVFEPFFTTKPVGKGTGLGLSTVYSILKSHGGFPTVHSEPGAGTTFGIYLPAVLEHERNGEATVPSEEPRVGSGEHVLVVDDEPYVLEATRETLESHGYHVATAQNGREALDVFNRQRDAIDAVLTDLMMPELDGIAVIRKLRRQAPRLPIIAVSGMGGGEVQGSARGRRAALPLKALYGGQALRRAG